MRLKGHLLSLHRYFIWADRMRILFLREVQATRGKKDAELLYGPFMDFWYGSLYVVVEGWRDLNLSDPVVDPYLASPNLDLLRLYRNGAFHYQPDYWSHKRTDLMVKGNKEVAWLHGLHAALGAFFLRELAVKPPARPA